MWLVKNRVDGVWKIEPMFGISTSREQARQKIIREKIWLKQHKNIDAVIQPVKMTQTFHGLFGTPKGFEVVL